MRRHRRVIIAADSIDLGRRLCRLLCSSHRTAAPIARGHSTKRLIAAITLLLWTRSAPISTRVALMGTSMVLGFVLIRAASFHHVDQFIGQRILGLRWNWILEMSGISLVLFASQCRQVGIAKSVSRSVHLNQGN
jgi:hypothetical protein